MRFLALLSLIAAIPAARGAGPGDDYRIYTEHPRLFLRPQRVRMLRRERERQSMRWTQLDSLVRGGAQFPEPGLVHALYYETALDNAEGRKAVEWALQPAADVRQAALVFDWCQSILSDAEKARLSEALLKVVEAGPPHDLVSARNAVLAAIAVADQHPDESARKLATIIEQWWRTDIAPRVRSGALTFSQADLAPLFELINAVRDNLTIDLREDAAAYFEKLPARYVSSFYPATWPAAENDYRIPSYEGQGPPDLSIAARARIGALEMVASDTNGRGSQYVQGWLVLDRFMLRGPFGAPYEFLWANPYQPGLAYAGLALVFYDPESGSLFVRSDWNDEATWFGIVGREFQIFQKGAVSVLDVRAAAGAAKPLEIGPAVIAAGPGAFHASGNSVFIIGLKPRTQWNVEIDRGARRTETSDRAGTIALLDRKFENASIVVSEHAASTVAH